MCKKIAIFRGSEFYAVKRSLIVFLGYLTTNNEPRELN